MIARLLHVANSRPDAVDKDRFYDMKSRILKRFGKRDGYDVQHIAGKECWSCDGTGGLYEPGGCYKCYGSGWFKDPFWVVLDRYRFGRFVFHIPAERLRQRPVLLDRRGDIEGYVTHARYGCHATEWACIALGVLFDWQLARSGLAQKFRRFRVVQSFRRKCIDCHCHTWHWKRWRCGVCQRIHDAMPVEDIPF